MTPPKCSRNLPKFTLHLHANSDFQKILLVIMEFQKNRPTFKFKTIRCHLWIFLAGLCDDKTLKRSNTFLRLRPSSRTSSRVSPESSPKSPKSSNHRNYNGKIFFPLFLVENFVILNQPKIHELKKFRMLTFSLFAEARTYKMVKSS